MLNINWKAIAFWVCLWWFIYSAPTEGLFIPLPGVHSPAQQASASDDF
jgi:hypothetical protein